jgi:sugar phosphate isomerase/epimerase
MLDWTPPLSVTLAPLVRPGGTGVRRAIERVASMGFRSVQLSAAQQGLRPRELSRRARQDVLATLSRNGLMLGGLDLMIPHRDWLEPATQDRATAAALAALDLAADLGQVPLCMTLPVERLGDDIAEALLTAADARGVLLTVHAEHDLDALADWLSRHDQPKLGAGLDPAALLAEGHDPSDVVVRFAEPLRVARVDDHATTSVASAGGRCAVGGGDLDVLAYRAALSTCRSLRGIVMELRGLSDPVAALQAGARVWEPGEEAFGM